VEAKDDVDGNLNIRSEATTNSEIIEKIAKGEELLILDANVASNDKDNPVWVKVSLDSDTEEGSVGYVSKKYVDPSFQLVHALSLDEIYFGSGVSGKRIDIVNFAKDYLGGKYVYGGTSLTRGIDCSAFVRACLNQFGIYGVPRTSREQARSGDKISASELKPGDLVFYGGSSINHVAMYIGNGKVIHASNHRDGIKISNMYYRSPVKFVTYIHD
jgi:cell wall-associated NlpC family hydrolase